MKPDELAKLIGVEEIEVKKFLAKEEIMNIEEDHPMSRECQIVASYFVNKLKLNGLINKVKFIKAFLMCLVSKELNNCLISHPCGRYRI